MCKSGASEIVYGARVDSKFISGEATSRQWTPRSVADKKKIEARLSSKGKTLLYLAEVLKVPVQELFPLRTPGNRIHEFIEKLETTRF